MRIGLVMLLVLAACHGSIHDGFGTDSTSRAALSPEETFNMRWRGKLEQEILFRYGSPNEVIALPSGNRIDSYHAENNVSSSRSAFYNGAGGSSSEANGIYCDRRFEVAQEGGRVLRATIVGNGCDYEK